MASVLNPDTITAVRSVGKGIAAGFTIPAMQVGDMIDVTDEWATLITRHETRTGETCPVRLLDLTTGTHPKGTGSLRNAMHATLVRAARKVNGDASQYVRQVVTIVETDDDGNVKLDKDGNPSSTVERIAMKRTA